MRALRLLPVLLACWMVVPAQAQLREYRLVEPGEWAAADAPELSPDEAVIARARGLLAADRPSEAWSLLDPWIKANEHLDHPLLAEAYLLRGDAKVAWGNERKALYDYEALIARFPASEHFPRAVERELVIAIRYVNGPGGDWFAPGIDRASWMTMPAEMVEHKTPLKRRVWGLRIGEGATTGEELLTRVAERMPGTRLAERAIIELADYYYRRRDLRLANDAYDAFLKNFPRSQYARKAMQRRIYANIGRFKGPQYDASGLTEARALVEDFMDVYPLDAERAGLSDALSARLEESAAAQVLDTARWYLRKGDPVAARFTFRRLLARHAGTVAARRGLEELTARGWSIATGAGLGVPGFDTDPADDPDPAETLPENGS